MIEIKDKYTGEVIYIYEGDSLVGADLSKANLSNANLEGADLSKANLRGAYLNGATLERSNLYCADIVGADLSGADLFEARLYKARLQGANMSRAHLIYADLGHADLSGANLSYANLTNAYAHKANLTGADLDNTNLFRSDLRDAILEGVFLRGTNMAEADTSHKYITIIGIDDRSSNAIYCIDTDTMWYDYTEGTLEEFSKKVEDIHGDNPRILEELRGAIKYLELLKGIHATYPSESEGDGEDHPNDESQQPRRIRRGRSAARAERLREQEASAEE